MHWIALHWPAPEPGAPEAEALPPAEALGWWALQFTPHVARCAEGGPGHATLLLEVSACERLWGGRAALMRQIAASAPGSAQPPVRPRLVQGASSLVALARLRLFLRGQPPPTDALAHLPHDLPLWTLAAAQPHLDVLAGLGCRSWSQAEALPRAGLVRRFGPELREALDVAWGRRPERHAWLTLPEAFDQRAELPALATQASELLWAAQRLLAALRLWLQARQRGVLAIELAWTLDLKRLNGVELPREQQLRVRTAEPTQDMAHLRRLLAERLAHTALAAPTGWLRLRSLETAPWGGATRSLLPPGRPQARGAEADAALPGSPGEERPGEPWHQLVEKLSARLGPQQVRVPLPQADHRPERMQCWQPAVRAADLRARASAGKAAAASRPATPPPGWPSALLPPWLLPEPQPLALHQGQPHYHGPLRRCVGPQRVEGDGWWEDARAGQGAAVARDYYIAHSPQAGLVWIYRERPGVLQGADAAPRWFLHGLYG